MKAIQFDRLGGPEVISLREVPKPEIAPGTILVRNHVIAVNFGDLFFIRGLYLVKPAFPDTPGMEGAGVIEAVAPDVKGLEPGMRVGYIGMGAFAEYARIRASRAIPLPDDMSFEQGASFPIAALTAWHLLHTCHRTRAGETVIIHSAAGGVGIAAVQIAKAAGARVIGTASPNNHEFLKSIGADEVIDYRAQKFEDVVKNADLVLNTVDSATGERSIRVLRQGGVLVSIVGPPNLAACASGKIRCARPNRDTGAPSADLLERIAELADAGKFKVYVEAAYPMTETKKAWMKSREGHTRGKLVIQVSPGPTMKHQ